MRRSRKEWIFVPSLDLALYRFGNGLLVCISIDQRYVVAYRIADIVT